MSMLVVRCLSFMRPRVYFQGPDGDKNLQMALNEPQMFVLKPQREGGG